MQWWLQQARKMMLSGKVSPPSVGGWNINFPSSWHCLCYSTLSFQEIMSISKMTLLYSIFLTFPVSQSFFFSNFHSNCSNVLDMRSLQEQVKKHHVSKIGLTFHFLNELFECKFLAFGFFDEYNFFFSQMARTILETKYYYYKHSCSSHSMGYRDQENIYYFANLHT